jgi:hypothetical protein
MTDERLKEIQERLNKATPGPWRISPRGGSDEERPFVDNKQYDVARMCHEAGVLGEPSFAWADADFIAYAREDIPFLLAEVERLTRVIAEAVEDTHRLDEFTWGPFNVHEALADLRAILEGET